MSVLPMDIYIRKCQFCLRILISRSVMFVYVYYHPELYSLTMDIFIGRHIMHASGYTYPEANHPQLFFGSMIILVFLMD